LHIHTYIYVTIARASLCALSPLSTPSALIPLFVFFSHEPYATDLGPLHWARGKVIKHNYEEPKGKFHPYQVTNEA